MTPEQFKKIRNKLGLSQRELAEKLRLKKTGGRHIRSIESGDTPVTGPVSVCMEYFEKYLNPKNVD